VLARSPTPGRVEGTFGELRLSPILGSCHPGSCMFISVESLSCVRHNLCLTMDTDWRTECANCLKNTRPSVRRRVATSRPTGCLLDAPPKPMGIVAYRQPRPWLRDHNGVSPLRNPIAVRGIVRRGQDHGRSGSAERKPWVETRPSNTAGASVAMTGDLCGGARRFSRDLSPPSASLGPNRCPGRMIVARSRTAPGVRRAFGRAASSGLRFTTCCSSPLYAWLILRAPPRFRLE
jgi:hypothetical protein